MINSVIILILFFLFVFVLLIPSSRLLYGRLKNFLTSANNPIKSYCNNNIFKLEKTETKTLNYIQTHLNQGDIVYLAGGSAYIVTSRTMPVRSIFAKIFAWDQVVYRIIITPYVQH